VVYYRNLPPDLAELLTVQVLDKLPLCLSSDPNVHLEENTDYYGEDITSCKAKDLDTAIQILHKHPTAVAFTYILPDSEHKLNGTVFLKGKKPVCICPFSMCCETHLYFSTAKSRIYSGSFAGGRHQE
jgi:hypothetical protein